MQFKALDNNNWILSKKTESDFFSVFKHFLAFFPWDFSLIRVILLKSSSSDAKKGFIDDAHTNTVITTKDVPIPTYCIISGVSNTWLTLSQSGADTGFFQGGRAKSFLGKFAREAREKFQSDFYVFQTCFQDILAIN